MIQKIINIILCIDWAIILVRFAFFNYEPARITIGCAIFMSSACFFYMFIENLVESKKS